MTILFIAVIAVVPVIIGRAALKWCLKKGKQSEIWENYIVGALLCVLAGEALHLCTVFLHWPFQRFAMLYGWVLVTVFLLSAALVAADIWKNRKNTNWQKNKKGTSLWVVVFGAVILLQCIFYIVMHQPDIGYDITLEHVNTMLSSDTVYQFNPMTGQAYTAGMPMRLKILALPSIYAAFCSWFHLNPQVVVYNLIPILVLIFSYMVLWDWAHFLYPEQEKKRKRFLFLAVLLLQFGNYAAVTASYGLFHMGFRGEVICDTVLYPYLLLMCFQKRTLTILLCLIVEVGMVWTWYGAGGGLLICGIVLLTLFLSGARKERGRAV